MTIPSDILIAILIGLVALLAIGIIRLEIKLRRLCRGTQGADLEESIVAMGQKIGSLEKFESESKSYYKNIEHRLRRSTQATEIVRFNAWKGDGLGGNQSFAAAFVNEEGDGAVISSLYSRERVSVFSKPVKAWKSEIDLSEEETQALAQAQAKLSK